MNYKNDEDIIGDENIREQFYDRVAQINDNYEFIKAHYLFARKDNVREEIINGIVNGTITKENDIRKITIKQSPVYKAGLIGDAYFERLEKYGN